MFFSLSALFLVVSMLASLFSSCCCVALQFVSCWPGVVATCIVPCNLKSRQSTFAPVEGWEPLTSAWIFGPVNHQRSRRPDRRNRLSFRYASTCLLYAYLVCLSFAFPNRVSCRLSGSFFSSYRMFCFADHRVWIVKDLRSGIPPPYFRISWRRACHPGARR